MPEPFFNVDFIRSLVTTFLGAFFAILVAVGGWWLSGMSKRKESTTRRIRLAQALMTSVEFNLGIAKEATELSDKAFLTTNVDRSVLEGTLSLKYEIMNDINLNRDIDEFGHRISLLHKFIETSFEMEHSGSFVALRGTGGLRDRIATMIRDGGASAIQLEKDKQIIDRLQSLR